MLPSLLAVYKIRDFPRPVARNNTGRDVLRAVFLRTKGVYEFQNLVTCFLH
jgi:hypothetical protein